MELVLLGVGAYALEALVGDRLPALVEEDNHSRGDQLLKRPTSGEPLAATEIRIRVAQIGNGRVAIGADIGQVGIADASRPILGKHGIDGLGQFAAAAFVDAYRVDPNIFEAVGQCLPAASIDFLIG